MKTITLFCGDVTFVSDEDYDRLLEHRWRKDIHNASRKPYVRATMRGADGRKTSAAMHRMVTQCPLPYRVDHRDGNGLHNWRGNLRIATQDQNNYNRAGFGACGFKGVTRSGKRFRARITHLEVEHYLGLFDTALLAAQAYDAKATEFYGEFAYLNFPLADREPSTEEVPF